MSILRSYAALTSGTISIPVDQTSAGSYPVVADNIITGVVTLVGPLAISPSGTPTNGQNVNVIWNASVTLAGTNITIFGETVPDELAAKNFVAECVYDGAAWVVNILPDFAGVGIVGSDRLAADSVTTAKIEDNAVTLAKMAGLAKGKIIYGDASGNPADIELGSSDGRMLLGDTAAGVAAVDMSGDATISKAGALTIANNAISTVKVADGAITPVKMSAGARKSSIAIPVSFETAGEIGVVKYTMCFDCTVDAIHATVTKAAATDTATAIFKNHGGTVLTGSQVDITTGLVLGNIVSTTPTANNTFTAGEQITIETSKTTPGSGNFTAILCLTHD
jgi:hypothetical protein